MLIKLIKDKVITMYPFAKELDFDNYYLVNESYADGVVDVKVYYDISGVPSYYLLSRDMYIIKNECNHTMGRDNICLTCSEIPFETETRPCYNCKCYKTNTNMWPYCSKKLMTVTSTTLARYYIKDGTCFESKEARNES